MSEVMFRVEHAAGSADGAECLPQRNLQQTFLCREPSVPLAETARDLCCQGVGNCAVRDLV